jgi:biotin carboxylase
VTAHALLLGSERIEPARLLAARPGVRLSVIVKPKYAQRYEGLGAVGCVDDLADYRGVLVAAVALMAEGGPFAGVFAAIERAIIGAGLVRTVFGVQGTGIETSIALTNKYVMKTRLAAAGVPVAPFALVPGPASIVDACRGIGWPVVLKPAIGSGSWETYRLDGPDDVARLLDGEAAARLAGVGVPLMVERYVPMTAELHCDGAVSRGRVAAVSPSRYFSPLLEQVGDVLGSYTLPDDDPARPKLVALHEKVVTTLGLTDGVTHMEVYETPAGLVFGEVTCRPGGGGVAGTIRRMYGWDIWDAFVTTGLGEEWAATSERRDQAVLGWCRLPGRNGLVTRLSGPDELGAIPGVVDVVMRHAVGQVVAERTTSSFDAGVAFFSVPTPDDVPPVVAALREAYVVETVEPEGAGAR